MNKARLVHPGFWFGKTPLAEAISLAKRGVGGFCLYGGTCEEIIRFVQTVRSHSLRPDLLISADYEDGLGRWVSDAPLLPSNLALGAANDPELAFEKGLLTALQARSLGVDWVFAPVLDLANNALNPIVNTRAFGATAQQVIPLASAFLDGLKKGGALNSLKHFPGHGDTTTDSHLALPVLQKNLAQLKNLELKPFQALLSKADSVMTGHLFLPSVDADFPASLSSVITTQLLRKELNYQGCILTDALLMKAIGNEKQAAIQALVAGADILLVPENPHALIDYLEACTLPPETLAHSEQIQNHLCARAQQMPRPSLQEAFAPQQLNLHTAQKALVQTGTWIPLQPGETVTYLEIGNSTAISAMPFLQTLQKSGIRVKKFPYKSQKLLILCFRRYQAFQGKIKLEEKEQDFLRQASRQFHTTASILLASPWALQNVLETTASLYTFSPAPEFQAQAARILCGLEKAVGSFPVSL